MRLAGAVLEKSVDAFARTSIRRRIEPLGLGYPRVVMGNTELVRDPPQIHVYGKKVYRDDAISAIT